MKTLLSFFALLLFLCTTAQDKEIFYDAHWNKCEPHLASFVSIVKKTDSGWLHKDYFISTKLMQMSALYADEAGRYRVGHQTYYHANGYLSSHSNYIDNKRTGLCYSFHDNGMMRDSAYYENGQIKDTYLAWHRNGIMRDSMKRINDSVLVSVSWFENGTPSQAGVIIGGFKNGKWKYFHNNGTLACIETYQYGEVLDVVYFDEEGKPDTRAKGDSVDAKFKGGDAAWQRKVYAKLYWPPGYKLANTTMVKTVVDLFIDENGKVSHAQIVVPFHPEFDKSVLNAVKYAGDWIPAKAKNRRIPFHFRQTVTFQQPEE
jgi:TonB family protein